MGGGPAGLRARSASVSCSRRTRDGASGSARSRSRLVDKGKQPGSHLLSGAVMNPRAAAAPLQGPARQLAGLPTYGEVPGEGVYLLTRKRALRIPPPPTLRNHGNWIVSIAQMSDATSPSWPRRAARSCCPRRPPTKLLVQHGRVVGIRSGDKGRGREGEPLGNFEPGSDIVAKVTVLAEGTPGT